MTNKKNNSGNNLESILRYKLYKENITNRIALIKEKIYGIKVQRNKQIINRVKKVVIRENKKLI